MKKLSLKELKINSFVTAVDEKLAETAKGGGSVRDCISDLCTAYIGCQPQTNEFKCSLVVCPTDKGCPPPTIVANSLTIYC